MRRSLTVLMLALLLMTGCGGPRPAPPPPAAPVAGDPSPPPSRIIEWTPPPIAAESPALERAADLLPEGDLTLSVNIEPSPAGAIVTERLLRDGDRWVAVQDEQVYATWFLRADGLWRLDPKGGGALLRYLPAVLEDGLTWKQQSGDAEVWFHLTHGPTNLGTNLTSSPAWVLTVLNRGERLDLTFGRRTGPVAARSVNWRVPDKSFTKWAFHAEPGALPAEQRAALLTPAIAGAPAPVLPVTPAEFQTALGAALLTARPDTTVIDLTGDGQPEYISGPVGEWTTQLIEIYRNDVTVARTLTPWDGSPAHRIRPVTFTGDKRTWLLYEIRWQDHSFYSLLTPQGIEIYGWAPKAQLAEGSRLEADPSGQITVLWDLNDPARHRWVRTYQLDTSNPDWTVVRQLSSRFEPAEDSLRTPATPEEALYAAWFAAWYDLSDELPRYFAGPNAATVLADVRKPDYGPGQVKTGTVLFKDSLAYGDTPVPIPEIQPGPVGPDGKVQFLVTLTMYESTYRAWGTATFGTDGQGRPVIVNLIVEGSQELGC